MIRNRNCFNDEKEELGILSRGGRFGSFMLAYVEKYWDAGDR